MRFIKFIIAALVVLCCATTFAGAEASIADFYEASGGIGVWGWVVIGVSAVAFGVLAFFTAGTTAATAPAWVAAVGTWVGSSVYGLTGIAATNAGLALLGGGAVAAGGLGIKGGVVLLTVLASTSADIAISYSVEEAMAGITTSTFVQESKKLSTLPLPLNAEGSAAYVDNLNWLKGEQEKLSDEDKEVGLLGEKMQALLSEAAIIMGRDMQATGDSGERVKDRAFMSLLNFQLSRFRESFKYAKDAVELAEAEKIDAGFAKYLFAVAYLYTKTATDNKAVQERYLVPAILGEGSSRSIPVILSVYLDRLFLRIHGGLSAPSETRFFMDLVGDGRFKTNAAVCLPLMTVRLVQEIKRCKKDIEILSKPGNDVFLRENGAMEALDVRLTNFIGLTEILEELTPHVEKFEKEFPRDYPFNSRNLKTQLENFHALREVLRNDVKETKARLASAAGTCNDSESTWWNPFSWWN